MTKVGYRSLRCGRISCRSSQINLSRSVTWLPQQYFAAASFEVWPASNCRLNACQQEFIGRSPKGRHNCHHPAGGGSQRGFSKNGSAPNFSALHVNFWPTHLGEVCAIVSRLLAITPALFRDILKK